VGEAVCEAKRSKPEGDDTFHCIGGRFDVPWGDGFIGIHRDRRADPFEPDDLDRLLPHTATIARVLKLKGELTAARRGENRAKDALDTLALAICTVDRRGRLLAANGAAETVLARGDGFGLRNGKVTTRSQADATALAQAIALASAPASPRAGSVAVRREAGKAPCLISVTPLIGRAGSAGVMLVFRDPDAEDISLVCHLRALFALSKAEAEIAVELGTGRSTAEILAERCVSANTLNAQLKSIMAKMDCHRQAEIAALAAALPRLRSG
jgi:DNA-binding CsgD family transcriptional regulator